MDDRQVAEGQNASDARMSSLNASHQLLDHCRAARVILIDQQVVQDTHDQACEQLPQPFWDRPLGMNNTNKKSTMPATNSCTDQLDFACSLDPQLDFIDLANRLMPNENEKWRSILNTKLRAAAWESTKR